MKRKSILALILAASILLVGCGSNNSKTNTSNNATGTPNEGTNAAGVPNVENNPVGSPNTVNDPAGNINNDVKNAIESGKDNAKAAGDSLKYTAMNLKDDIVKAGYTLKDSLNTKKDYFKGNETDYLLGNDVVRVYEYNNANDLEQDIKRIAPNGLTINGTNANYTKKPYYYRKGNSLIVYEGNEPAYVDEFKTMYGNTIIP